MMPTFGQCIRGLRMGYAWCERHGCYVRLSRTEKEDLFKIEVHPEGLISNRAKTGGEHIAWWPDGTGFDGINLDEIEGLRRITKVKRPFVWYFDENGKTK